MQYLTAANIRVKYCVPPKEIHHPCSILPTYHSPPQEKQRERLINGILSSLYILLPSTRKYKGQGSMSVTPQGFTQQHLDCRKDKTDDTVSSTNKVKEEKKDAEGQPKD